MSAAVEDVTQETSDPAMESQEPPAAGPDPRAGKGKSTKSTKPSKPSKPKAAPPRKAAPAKKSAPAAKPKGNSKPAPAKAARVAPPVSEILRGIPKVPGTPIRRESPMEALRQPCNKLKQIADPVRGSIVLTITDQELSVGQICAGLGLGQPAVSHHLALLRHSGIIIPRRGGKHIYYELTDMGRTLSKLLASFVAA